MPGVALSGKRGAEAAAVAVEPRASEDTGESAHPPEDA